MRLHGRQLFFYTYQTFKKSRWEEAMPRTTSSMEAPPSDETPAEELKASDGAIRFMSSIEPAELQRCLFADSLATVSEGRRDLGRFDVSVEFARRGPRDPCLLLLRARGHGAIDDSPCGTTVTAYLSAELEVLEEDHHEYLRLDGHSLDKRCHMVRRDGRMTINRVTAVGEEVTEESASYPVSALRGLVTEGSSLLLTRLLALRRTLPERATFISLDQGSRIVHTTFSELGVTQLEIGGETVEVFGVGRVVHDDADSPTTWRCHFLPDGHMASRVQVGSPVVTRLLQLPSQQQDKGLEKTPLIWEEDMEMHSNFLDRKEELRADHASYLRQHPEIRDLIADFLRSLLLRKPDNVSRFAEDYFVSRRPPTPGPRAPTL